MPDKKFIYDCKKCMHHYGNTRLCLECYDRCYYQPVNLKPLIFVVNGLSLELDPRSDIHKIDTHLPVKAEFIFKDADYTDWDNSAKVVAFYSCLGMSEKECTPKLLEDGKSCIIPSEAFSQSRLKIEIHGRRKDNSFYKTKYKTFRIINGGLSL